MAKQFIKRKGKARNEQGKKLIDVTINKKMMHYIFASLSKYLETTHDKKEIAELNVLIEEFSKINDELNGEPSDTE